jgi:hypothetical protein
MAEEEKKEAVEETAVTEEKKEVKNMAEEGKAEEMSLDQLEDMDSGTGIDVSEYEGQRCEVDTAEVIEVETPYDENGEYQEGLKRKVKRLRVFSKPVTEVEDSQGKKIQIRASELFALKYLNGKWGVSTNERAKINKFLKKLNLPAGAAGVKQLGGQQVIMKTSDKGNFLRFVY